MLLWFAGGALVAVWAVFHDPAIDHRLVVAGALLPDVIDAPFGGARVGHALSTSVLALVVIVLATRGRRSWRRRLLALPIGMFLHLVLDGAWTMTRVFWWPFGGWSFQGARLPSVARGWWSAALELAGLAALAWVWARFGLADPDRRRAFWRSGRLELVAPGGPSGPGRGQPHTRPPKRR